MALSQDLLRNGPTRLRTLEPEDVDWMMRWENAPEHWQVSGTLAPYSRAALEALCHGHQDVYTAGQEAVLLLRGLHAQVHAHNGASLQLFGSGGFEEIGRFKDWTRTQEGWHDAVLFQRNFIPQDT